MTDDAFRLTPVDIRAQEFQRELFGYNRGDVEDFKTRVAEELERLFRERVQIEERLNNMREQLKAYREREKAINEAVLVTQSMRQDAEEAARRQMELVVREAKVKAEQIVAAARAREVSLRREIDVAHNELSGYLTAFRHLLQRYLAQVNALEQQARDGAPPAAAPHGDA
jgi:DivIVA domain-containing protein